MQILVGAVLVEFLYDAIPRNLIIFMGGLKLLVVTVIELQLNSIRKMISKALTDNECSEAEFENILFQTTKQNET